MSLGLTFLSGALEHGPELVLKLRAGFAWTESWTVMWHRSGPLGKLMLRCCDVSGLTLGWNSGVSKRHFPSPIVLPFDAFLEASSKCGSLKEFPRDSVPLAWALNFEFVS